MCCGLNVAGHKLLGLKLDTHILPVTFLLLHLVVLVEHLLVTHLTVWLQPIFLTVHVHHTHTPTCLDKTENQSKQ